jgi:hypothetical protein
LPVHQRVSERKILGHSHHGIVDGSITMGMVFSYYLTHHSGGLDVTGSLSRPNSVHGVDNAPMYRFETITYIGKGSRNNGGKGVGKIAGFDFFMQDGLGNPHRQVFSSNPDIL